MALKHFEYAGVTSNGMNRDGECYLAINVDDKTNKRTTIAREWVEGFLWRNSSLGGKFFWSLSEKLYK